MFLIVTFQKARFFSAGGRHGREGTFVRQIEYSFHIEVRTLNARRMFREKWGILTPKISEHVKIHEFADFKQRERFFAREGIFCGSALGR